jgi:hypothetical protein
MFWLYKIIIRDLYVKERIRDPGNLMILYQGKAYWIDGQGKCKELLELQNFSSLAKKKNETK